MSSWAEPSHLRCPLRGCGQAWPRLAGPGRKVTVLRGSWPERGCEHSTPLASSDSAHPLFSRPSPELLVKRSPPVWVRVLGGVAGGGLSQ